MKAYKIDLSMYPGKVREVVSEAVQKKAFELGWKWNNSVEGVQFLDSEWIDLWVDATITQCWGDAKCDGHVLITADAFLSLESAEPEFKPFDKVLVRDEGERWRACLFSHIIEAGVYCASGMHWKYCIPYEGNEHLLGTTNKE